MHMMYYLILYIYIHIVGRYTIECRTLSKSNLYNIGTSKNYFELLV